MGSGSNKGGGGFILNLKYKKGDNCLSVMDLSGCGKHYFYVLLHALH